MILNLIKRKKNNLKRNSEVTPPKTGKSDQKDL